MDEQVALPDDLLEDISAGASEASALAKIQSEADALAGMLKDVQAAEKLVKSFGDRKRALAAKVVEAFSLSPDEEKTVMGSIGGITVSPCAKSREIADKGALVKALGAPLFVELAKVSLTDIDKYLTEAQKDAVLAEKAGSRSVKIIKA